MDSSSSSSSATNIHHIRSISLPNRSHPSASQVEQELSNLKSWESSPSSIDRIHICLTGLGRLYTCVNDLLSLPVTQQALSHNEKLVDELLDRSMRLLDVVASTKDALSQVKEHVRDVQSALRRRKGDLSIDTSFLKNTNKDAKRAVLALKQIDNKIGGAILLHLDQHLSGVLRSLRDPSVVSVSVFGSLLSFMTSMSLSKPKSRRWSMISKMIHKGKLETGDEPQISNVDLGSHVEVIENALECMFRSLIKTRASLLNIRSH